MRTHIKCELAVILFGLLSSPIDADELPNTSDLRDDSTLLRRSDVRKEIELIDDQAEALVRARDASRKRTREFRDERSAMSPQDAAAANKSYLVEMIRSQHATRQEVLLPPQLRRLEQLRWQYRAIDDPVKSIQQAFSLTDDQEQRLREKEQELRAEWLQEMRTSYRAAQREILRLLTPGQRAAWEKNVGAEFQFESSVPFTKSFFAVTIAPLMHWNKRNSMSSPIISAEE